MPKEIEFFNAASGGESATSSPAKVVDANGRSGSTSSKYRVASRPSNLAMQDSASAPRSPETRTSATDMLIRLGKNSSSRLALAGPGSSEPSAKPRASRLAIMTDGIATKATASAVGTPKLPQKLRQHVNRLRNQFASVSGSSRNLSLGSRSPSPKARPSMAVASSAAKRFSLAAAAVQYSRRSQLQQLEAAKEIEKQQEPETEAQKPPQEPEAPANAVTFQDLLRPLHNSLSCASLSSGWSSDEDDEAEQLFRQRERDNSHMLRVCCSIDNLLLSIGALAQEQKLNENVVRGATRDLVKLFQFAIKQVVSVIFGSSEDDASNNNRLSEDGRPIEVKLAGKEAQYAIEFIQEIIERLVKLDEFVRSVFVSEVSGLQEKAKQLEEELAAAALKNVQLQNEMRDLRDFHEQNNVTSMDAFAVSHSDAGFPDENSNDVVLPALAFTDIPSASTDPDEGENDSLKQQCQELSRLLEMAKQEIRLSHHERDVHKAHVAELSSALFRDSELGLLRNQLQSEKRRVRVLERENLALRETQQDHALKLQALQTANADPITITSGNGATGGRRSSGAAHTEADVISPVLSSATNGKPGDGGSSKETLAVQTLQPALESDSNQYNFTTTSPTAVQEAEGASTNWFQRIINPPVTNLRSSRKKKVEPKLDERPPVALTKFFASLMMSDKQMSAAQEESKVRRQGNIPSIDPPIGAKRGSRSNESSRTGSKKRRPRSATATSNTLSESSTTEPAENRDEIVACCLQLVWAFYQRFLLAVEAQGLLGIRGLGGDPTMGSQVSSVAGSPAWEPVSLSHIIFHFFFERCANELEASRELEQLVRCVNSVREAGYGLELFCQFLEETRSRQELCFFLWVCQAIDQLSLGVPYHAPLPSSSEYQTSTQYICVLKATYLARTIFRLLHFKVLCRPDTARSGKHRGKAKRSPLKRKASSPAAAVMPAPSPASSPKRKPKTRIGEVTAVLSAVADPVLIGNSVHPQGEQQNKPPYVKAQAALREVVDANPEHPITLETFNSLLLQFAVVPSAEELTARLGVFYQPTGDERKIPLDVFLALLMETYRFQMHWQRDQLCALFIHLKHQEEIQQRLAEKLAKAEADGLKGDRRKNGGKQPKLKSRKKRSRDEMGGAAGGNKYLRGLSRSVLREVVLQAGIIHDSDLAQIDLDWLFAGLVKAAGGNAMDITFDTLFDALDKMGWLNSSALQVDVESTGMSFMSQSKRGNARPQSQLHTRAASLAKPRPSTVPATNPALLAVREKWRVYARRSIAVCSNDPNMFVRRHSDRLLHYVDHQFSNTFTQEDSGSGEISLHSIREFLVFAWRIAAKRSGKAHPASRVYLTEVFFVCQALRAAIDTMPGYDHQLALTGSRDVQLVQPHRTNEVMFGGLQSFCNTSQMHVINDTVGGSAQSQELESVLTLYAAHIAHLFQRFSEARFNSSPQVSLHRWRAMMYELRLVHPKHLPFSKLQALFFTVVESLRSTAHDGSVSIDQDVGVGKTPFSELFVLVALERHRVLARMKQGSKELPPVPSNEELTERPARVMAVFCRDVLAPRAFCSEESSNSLVERNFAAKMSCPLVGRALLEHRAFLRAVFFYYAKQDEVAADELALAKEQALVQRLEEHGEQQDSSARSNESDVAASLLQPDPGDDFQLEKTKRSSMSFGEFQTFLTAFGLYSDGDEVVASRGAMWNHRTITPVDARSVFSSVMALDNDDTAQLEFDEFSAAIMAIALHLHPDPFKLWHQKLDKFATTMRTIWEEGARLRAS